MYQIITNDGQSFDISATRFVVSANEGVIHFIADTETVAVVSLHALTILITLDEKRKRTI